MITYFRTLVLLILGLILISCSNGGSCANPNPGPSVTPLHTFSNGSQLFGVTSLEVPASDITTTTFVLKGGSGKTIVTLSTQESGVEPARQAREPRVSGVFNPDNLVVENSTSESSSQLTVKARDNLAPGEYYLNVFAVYENNGVVEPRQQIAVIKVVVTASPRGQIVVFPFAQSEIMEGASTTAVVSLSGSSGIVNPVTVTLINHDPSVMSIAPTSCQLTTLANECTIIVTGVGAGAANFTAQADGYLQVDSDVLTVSALPVAGSLHITPFAKSGIEVDESTTAIVSLVGSSGITTPVSVSIMSQDLLIASVTPDNCSLTTESDSCVITLMGESIGVTNVTASATNYAQAISESLVVKGPALNFLVTGTSGLVSTFTPDYQNLNVPMTAFYSVIMDSSGKLYIGGMSGLILSSTDLTTYAMESTVQNTSYIASMVESSNGTLVAVGASNIIFTFTNNVWSTTPLSDINLYLYGVTQISNGMYIAVGSSTSGRPGAIYTSIDGVTWNDSSSQATSLTAVTSFGSRVVAVGENNRIYYSDDNGVNWTSVTVSGTSGNYKAVTVDDNGNYVAVGTNGIIAVSSNGSTWSAVANTTGSTSLNGVAVDSTQGVFIAVGNEGKRIRSTDNGASWNVVSSGISNQLNAIYFNNGMFVTVGNNGTILMSDDDGTSWSALTTNSSSITINSVTTAANGIFVGVANNATVTKSSDGGNTWTSSIIPSSVIPAYIALKSIAGNGNIFIAVGGVSDSTIIRSNDNGVTWSKESAGIANRTLNNVQATPGGRFIVVGNSATAIVSNNKGESWVYYPIGEPATAGLEYKGVAISESGVAIAIADSSYTAVSTNDGESWVVTNHVGLNSLSSITVNNNGTFIVVGNVGLVARSTDNGTTWSMINTPATYQLTAVAANDDGDFIAVGVIGQIIQSSDDGQTWTQFGPINGIGYTAITKY